MRLDIFVLKSVVFLETLCHYRKMYYYFEINEHIINLSI